MMRAGFFESFIEPEELKIAMMSASMRVSFSLLLRSTILYIYIPRVQYERNLSIYNVRAACADSMKRKVLRAFLVLYVYMAT